jgi:hypothetical protein
MLAVHSLLMAFLLSMCFYVLYKLSGSAIRGKSLPGKHRTCFTPFDQNVLFLQTSTVNPLYTNNEMPPETTQISSIKLSQANSCLRLCNGESPNDWESSMFSSTVKYSRMTSAEMFVETLVYSPFDHLKRLLARSFLLNSVALKTLKCLKFKSA